MGVTTSNRRERVRHNDGTTTLLAGGDPSTGLSAIAAATAGVTSLSGAARAATHSPDMTPYAEATLGFESTRSSAPTYDQAANTGATVDLSIVYPSGFPWVELAQPIATPLYLAPARERRNNAQWSVLRADVHVCDDLQSQAGPESEQQGAQPDASAPWVARPPAGFARLIANAEADPAGTAWTLTGADLDENLLLDPSFTLSTQWPAVGGTSSVVGAGGLNGVKYKRVVYDPALPSETRVRFGQVPAGPGCPVSLMVVAKGTATLPTMIVDVYASPVRYTGSTMDPDAVLLASYTFGLSTAWQTFKMEYVTNPLDVPGFIVPVVRSVGLANAGAELHIDSVKGRRDLTVGTWGDGGTAGWAWQGTAGITRAFKAGAATAGATYSRPTDVAAPALGLTPATTVHRRTGVAAAGDRLSSPTGVCRYVVTGTKSPSKPAAPSQARTFTIAGWVRYTPGGSSAGAPLLRWVLETRDTSGVNTDYTYSEPFAAPVNTYLRFARTMVLAMPGGGEMLSARVHLEVVDPRGAVSATATLSARGVHLYAGSDRGDTEGLKAVPTPDQVTARVGTSTAAQYGTTGQAVTRVDVHGNDRVSHITSATATVRYAVTTGTTTGHLDAVASGGSPGRLTIRGLTVPDGIVGGSYSIGVDLEECNAGPGGDLAFGNVEGWFEEDVSSSIVTLAVDRSTDADPSSSTVPVGNFAASSIDLTLDDADGSLDLFSRTYIDTGHRIDSAVGVVYTNRHDDPEGIDAALAGGPSATWPTAALGTPPVVPMTPDKYGQVPPAAYAGHATGAASVPLVTTAPMSFGQNVRAYVWFRWSGGTAVPTIKLQGAISSFTAGTGWVTTPVGSANTKVLPSGLEPNRWYLLDLADITLDAACNVAAITCQANDITAGTWYELAAPRIERWTAPLGDGGEVVEVVETTPAGVFYSTSYGDGTGGAEVQVSGIDVLAHLGGTDIAETIVASSTVEDYSRDVARRYLDLGEDQVRIVDQDTPLTYVLPADTAATMLADLAKTASLTAYTDGLGRLSMLLRSEVPDDYLTEYLDDRNLLEASSAITPDQVINDVAVTVHPATIAAAPVELATIGRADPVAAGTPWVPTDGEVSVPSHSTFEVFLDRSAALELATLVQLTSASDPFVRNIPTDGYLYGNTTATVTHFAQSSKLTINNGDAFTVVLVRAAVTGRAITETEQTVRQTNAQSVADFGRRSSSVDVRLARSTALAPGVAAGVLESYSLRDPSGERWLPDLNATVLGDPWRELGDRVVVADEASGLSGEFRVLSHRYEYGIGADSSLYLRRVPTGLLYLIVDVDLADDGKVTSY